MAKSKTIKNAPRVANESTKSQAYIKFSNVVGLSIEFDTVTRKLKAKLFNIEEDLELSGEVVLTEEE